eukprot:gnl/TRDRNA2_/TRDRNA2_196582_c0_seq1.p1 gnl/TRDRNA2_/TRDRNA2_196582_c0~~gnl/TRDRNA2_/TRDRNA2_196582_c0_seq1.p1  ORF type:complete len:286 (+),score=36.73 gnl/TRDRNA2_/TRDRNA2_196582_c0_seq1:71-928(+)
MGRPDSCTPPAVCKKMYQGSDMITRPQAPPPSTAQRSPGRVLARGRSGAYNPDQDDYDPCNCVLGPPVESLEEIKRKEMEALCSRIEKGGDDAVMSHYRKVLKEMEQELNPQRAEHRDASPAAFPHLFMDAGPRKRSDSSFSDVSTTYSTRSPKSPMTPSSLFSSRSSNSLFSEGRPAAVPMSPQFEASPAARERRREEEARRRDEPLRQQRELEAPRRREEQPHQAKRIDPRVYPVAEVLNRAVPVLQDLAPMRRSAVGLLPPPVPSRILQSAPRPTPRFSIRV